MAASISASIISYVDFCWQLGEPEHIAFWHDLDAGFAGRKIIED